MNDLRDLRIRRLAAAAAATATLGLAGCGGGNDPAPTGGGGDPSDRTALAKNVPASAVAYAEGAIKLEGAAKDGVVDIAQKLGGVQDPGGQLLRELNSGDVQFSRDVDPAIGDEVAAWAGKPSGGKTVAALVFEVEDKGKADQLAQRGDDFPQEAQSGGQTIRVDPSDGTAIWIGDEVGAVGTREGVAATIAAQGGETLEKDQRFSRPVGKLPDGEDLAVAWYDPAGAADLVDALEKQAGSTGAAGNPFGAAGSAQAFRRAVQRDGAGPAAVIVQPKPGQVLVEGVETRTKAPTANPEDAAKSVGATPADSLAAIGLGDIGTTVGDQLRQGGAQEQIAGQVRQATGLDLQDDLLSWMGTGAVFVRGSGINDIGGALVVQAKDPAKASSAIKRLSSRLTSQGAQISQNAVPGAETSVAVNGLGPIPVLAAVKGGKFALGVNAQAVQQALDGGRPLSGSPVYGRAKQALGGMSPQVLVDGSKTSSLVDNLAGLGGASSDPSAQKAIAGVKRVQLLTAGSAVEGQDVRSRFVLTYR